MAKLFNGDNKKSAKANDGEAKKVIRLDDAEMEGIAGGVTGGYDPRYNVANPTIPVTNGGPDTNVALI